MKWLINNIGTICVTLILLIIILLIIKTLINDKKNGKSSCGCNCGHCAFAGLCHKNSTNNEVIKKHSPLKI